MHMQDIRKHTKVYMRAKTELTKPEFTRELNRKKIVMRYMDPRGIKGVSEFAASAVGGELFELIQMRCECVID